MTTLLGLRVLGVVMVFRDGSRKRFDEADVDRINAELGDGFSGAVEGLVENVACGELELGDGAVLRFQISRAGKAVLQ